MENPEVGPVMPGCGALRKVRAADPKRGKGRRGGVRVVYVYVPEARQFLLVAAYSKDEMDSPTKAQQRVFKMLSEQFCREVRENLPPEPEKDETDG